MAKLSTDELLDAFKELTLLELSEFVKKAAQIKIKASGSSAARAESRIRKL